MTAIPHSKTFLGEIKLFLNHQSCLIMLGLYILLLLLWLWQYGWHWGGRLSFMCIGDERRTCHSPWLEPVFRATNSHNHTNPHKTSPCRGLRQPRARITTKKPIWRDQSVQCPLESERIWEAGSLFSLIFICLKPSRRGDVAPKRGLPGRRPGIKLIYACIPGR